MRLQGPGVGRRKVTYMPLEGGAGLPKMEEVVALSPASMVNLCTVKSSDKIGEDDNGSWAGIIFQITTILWRTTVRKAQAASLVVQRKVQPSFFTPPATSFVPALKIPRKTKVGGQKNMCVIDVSSLQREMWRR
jgi:hypothetical protein